MLEGEEFLEDDVEYARSLAQVRQRPRALLASGREVEIVQVDYLLEKAGVYLTFFRGGKNGRERGKT